MESTATATAAATTCPVDKDFFYSQLNEFYSVQKNKLKKPWSLERHSEVIKTLCDCKQAIKNKTKRTNEQYYFGNHYDCIEFGGIKKVIKKPKNESDLLIFEVPYEEIYDKLLECHQNTGHGGRDKMKVALSHKYHIQRTCIEIFLKCCTRCTQKKNPSHNRNNKVIVTKEWNHRGQIDLIDMEKTPDGEYKYLLNYQDNVTKFTHLRPLKNKTPEDVSLELLKIFLEFGAPYILQSNNGREFVNAVINDLATRWPVCKILNGRSRHPQNRNNQDVLSMLKSWLNDNNTQNWSLGCYYVQWHKNSSFNRVVGRSPYKALFGGDFKVGLNSSNLPNELINSITTEEELYDVLNNKDLREAEIPNINNDFEFVAFDV